MITGYYYTTGINRNATVLYGAINTTFECEPPPADVVNQWTKWGYDGKVRVNSIDNILRFQAIYASYKTFNSVQAIVLLKADLPESGTYICTTARETVFYAQLVVIDHISEPIAKDITFPLTVGDRVSVVCSLVFGGAYAAGRYSSELSGAQDPELILMFGARYFPVTSINHGVVRYNITKNGTFTFQLLAEEVVQRISWQCIAISVASGTTTRVESALVSLPYPLYEIRINATKSKGNLFNVHFGAVVNCSVNSLRLPVVQWTPVKPKAANNPLRGKTGPAWALLKLSVPGSVTWSCSASTDEDVPPETKDTFTFSVGELQENKSQLASAGHQLSWGSVVHVIVLASLTNIR